MVSIGGDPYGGWAKNFLDYWYGKRVIEAVRESEKRVRLRAEVKKNNPSMSREELNAEIRRIRNEQIDKEFDLLQKELTNAAEGIKKNKDTTKESSDKESDF